MPENIIGGTLASAIAIGMLAPAMSAIYSDQSDAEKIFYKLQQVELEQTSATDNAITNSFVAELGSATDALLPEFDGQWRAVPSPASQSRLAIEVSDETEAKSLYRICEEFINLEIDVTDPFDLAEFGSHAASTGTLETACDVKVVGL